jgi:hypothetical protein
LSSGRFAANPRASVQPEKPVGSSVCYVLCRFASSLLAQVVYEPADTRRAGFDPLSLSLALELQRTVCTLYLVFKEPRRERLLFPISSPSTAALVAAVLFRRTFQDYICSFHRVNKNFSVSFVDRFAHNTRRRTFAEQEPQAVTSEQAFQAGTSFTDRNDVSD